MRLSNEYIENLTKDKINSSRAVDKLVTDELLKMGFSYKIIGTHYLHDSIVYSTSLKLEDFKTVGLFCREIEKEIKKKYNIKYMCYYKAIESSIERAFEVGNINYLLETFKSVYDSEKMKVTKNEFIMVMRKKVIEDLEEQQPYNTTQLRLIIQGIVENITDITLLQALCNIVASVESGVTV